MARSSDERAIFFGPSDARIHPADRPGFVVWTDALSFRHAPTGAFPEILREAFGSRTLPREPEPDLVMDGPDQVLAFAEAGRSDGVMAASYLFNSARISLVIQGCRSVVDLGCGPATQLAQVAGLHPDVEFIGIDLSAPMLANAEAHVRELGLTNVRFIHGDITEIPGVADRSSDAVISTLALHHLPTREHLRQCFRQIQRVLKPGGAVYVADRAA